MASTYKQALVARYGEYLQASPGCLDEDTEFLQDLLAIKHAVCPGTFLCL